VISGADTGLVRFADNPSPTNPGTNVANMVVDHTNYHGSESQNVSHASGTLTETHHVSGVPAFIPGSFRPAKGSILVDAGDPGFIPQAGETDLDGSARVLDGDKDGTPETDLGAYELIQPSAAIKRIKVTGHRATVKFKVKSSSDVACKLDSGTYGPCGSPVVFKHLQAGRHKVRVRARDSVYKTKAVAKKSFEVRHHH
jgi:hypothetical protein